MFLTKKQLEIIAQQIASISVKDSDFEEASFVNNDDYLIIVQDGVNKKISIEALKDAINSEE